MSACIGKFIFAFILMFVTTPVYIIAIFLHIMICLCPGTKECAAYFVKYLLKLAWWLGIKLSCCLVSIKSVGLDELAAATGRPGRKPMLVIQNHVSFFDVMVAGTSLPARAFADSKGFASGHLLSMPIIGRIMVVAGHFIVPFKNHETKKTKDENGGSIADFSVDKDSMEKVNQDFEDWVRSGHIGTWFPEGRLNPNPDKMQMFRAGGFKVAVEIDCELWCGVGTGFDVFWDRKAAIGGTCARCQMNVFKLCDSTFDLIRQLSNGDETIEDKQKCVLIANHAQERMQATYDAVVKEGYVSRAPEQPKKKDEREVALVEAGGAQAS